MNDKLSLLVQAWRDEAEDISTGKHATNNRRRKSALIMCANQLEAALAASGTLTDEQIEEMANVRSDELPWGSLSYREGLSRGAKWARSQIAASGTEPKSLDLADTFAPHDAERIAAYQRANAAPGAKALDLADRLVAERGCSHHALDVQAAAALRAAYGTEPKATTGSDEEASILCSAYEEYRNAAIPGSHRPNEHGLESARRAIAALDAQRALKADGKTTEATRGCGCGCTGRRAVIWDPTNCEQHKNKPLSVDPEHYQP